MPDGVLVRSTSFHIVQRLAQNLRLRVLFDIFSLNASCATEKLQLLMLLVGMVILLSLSLAESFVEDGTLAGGGRLHDVLDGLVLACTLFSVALDACHG